MVHGFCVLACVCLCNFSCLKFRFDFITYYNVIKYNKIKYSLHWNGTWIKVRMHLLRGERESAKMCCKPGAVVCWRWQRWQRGGGSGTETSEKRVFAIPITAMTFWL